MVPVFNEKENIEALCKAISAAMEPTSYSFEMILVNDGSTDDTWDGDKQACGGV